ncbi:hypothetical protein SAMN02910289_01145, partial [Lachnospiraceae bacterium RM5]
RVIADVLSIGISAAGIGFGLKELGSNIKDDFGKNFKNISESIQSGDGGIVVEDGIFGGSETQELFLPDEYYENLNKNLQYGYQEPNTKEVYRRLGNTSHEIETSVVISDEFGRIKYRIDYSTHGNNMAHTNPHIHEFIGNTTKGNYSIQEKRYFLDENTGIMRHGKANGDGTYRWLD